MLLARESRTRGFVIAFASIDDRPKDRMIRTAVYAQALEDWFFSTLNEAVQHCLRHQHQKTDAPKDIEGAQEAPARAP